MGFGVWGLGFRVYGFECFRVRSFVSIQCCWAFPVRCVLQPEAMNPQPCFFFCVSVRAYGLALGHCTSQQLSEKGLEKGAIFAGNCCCSGENT